MTRQEAAPGRGLILLVDDESSIRRTAAGFLSGLGYEVLTADNGARAVELYHERGADIALVERDLQAAGFAVLQRDPTFVDVRDGQHHHRNWLLVATPRGTGGN